MQITYAIYLKYLNPYYVQMIQTLVSRTKTKKELFHTVNLELNEVFEWFNANKLPFNKEKTKYALFHRVAETDNISLKLPSLFLSDKEIERTSLIKFLRVLIDDHFT